MDTEFINNVIEGLSGDGLAIFKFIQQFKRWEDPYTFKKTEYGKYWWTCKFVGRSGRTVNTIEEVKMCAFIHWCNSNPISIKED
jgi:hypothetical protein